MKVEPVMAEVGRYWVESRTTPGQRHLADILENQCGCPDYVCRRGKHRARWGEDYRCAHIRAAREYCLNNFLETVREEMLKT